LALAQSNCTVINFDHAVQLKEWAAIDTDEAGLTTHERYSAAYEGGWWHCIYCFQRNIDYRPETSDESIPGWPSETYGYLNGFEDALQRIKSCLQSHAKDEVKNALAKLRIPDTLHYEVKR